MRRKKLVSLVLAAMIPFGILVGCSSNNTEKTNAESTTSESDIKAKDKLVYALWSSPTGIFNPLLADTTYDSSVISLTYTSLLQFDENLNLKPDLAESYEVSDDNLNITFKLRKDVKWHDGKPFTANDVAFTFASIANKDYQGSSYGDVEKIKGAKEYHEGKTDKISGIEIVDDYTIKFVFDKPYAPALTNIGGMGIIPKHIWESVPIAQWKEKKDLLTNPVGTGPFKIAAFNEGQDVQLERFDNYYGEHAKTKKFIFKVVNEDTAQVELLNGTIDIADVSNLKNEELEDLKTKGMNIESYPNSLFQYMGFNLRKDIFKDTKVRQAFMYGIDRKTMVDKLLGGNGVVMNMPILPNSWAYPKDDKVNQYEYNVDKAKELLKEAGYEDKNGNGIVENKDGEEFKVTLTYPTGNKLREQTAPIIKENMKKVGVEVELEGMEFNALMDKVVGNHEFELYLMGNNLGVDPDPKPHWHSTSASDEKGVYAWNIASFKNKEADKLIEEGLKVFDNSKRKEIYSEFGQLMNKEVPWAYLYDQNIMKASNSKVKNFKPATQQDFFNVEQWYVEE